MMSIRSLQIATYDLLVNERWISLEPVYAGKVVLNECLLKLKSLDCSNDKQIKTFQS